MGIGEPGLQHVTSPSFTGLLMASREKYLFSLVGDTVVAALTPGTIQSWGRDWQTHLSPGVEALRCCISLLSPWWSPTYAASEGFP